MRLFKARSMTARDSAAGLALLFALVLLVAPAAPQAKPQAKPPGGNSSATVSGSFSDSCRDFATHSSKDISHVEIHFAGGAVVKDETINDPDYSVDGGPGAEISFVVVKSGTTRERFDCIQRNSPPTARLEIRTPPIDSTLGHCYAFFAGGLACEQSAARTDWTSTAQVPNDGGSESGVLHWGCGAFTDFSHCPLEFHFRGTSSSDPDNDITTWSLAFDDGGFASGSWSAAAPSDVAHTYVVDPGSGVGCSGAYCVVTLTVTDSAGQSDSDTLTMAFVDQTPD
jgi:hypothetical protein